MPEFAARTSRGRIERVEVIRGAPCGATWEAAEAVKGFPVEDAASRIGLLVQCYCKANPAGWDPISGKSPIHIAGKHHAEALRRALKRD